MVTQANKELKATDHIAENGWKNGQKQMPDDRVEFYRAKSKKIWSSVNVILMPLHKINWSDPWKQKYIHVLCSECLLKFISW